ncbi:MULTISPECIES: ATP-binding protein [Pseudomonas]|uniref:AAA family ATPase n=1 Tax=Pseudomonas spirodelae TaxID=3101751 RepID=A0ABU5P9W6_9PSED|nr:MULTISPECIES: AAA family ATPase [unclassified Pseudomonas]MDD2161443.1 AAA family ATPase [Pseudomonas sp. MIL19]MEA1606410.1 AAA family ATPase [Pseudomonas sp. T5W1]
MTDTAHFPLAAVVGADDLKLALCLAAIDPAIGGVLIEGPRGMAKSTLARGLADLLASGTFVTLPLGASEERIVGTLDLDAALGEGRAQFSPGLLAKANGGVLYVDEVNLLPDHLVDLLLDAAASGVNHIERDGISHRHAARFMLIGTMNAEEGELRPQLLDRFGLNLAMDAQPQPAQRAEIVRRRLAFDADPQAFLQRWQTQQDELSERCQSARARLAAIPLDDAALEQISQRCFAAAVDGLRADLVWLRAARAHAAWRGVEQIAAEDIDAVADFVLRHRRRHNPPPAAQPPHSQPESQANNSASSEQPQAPQGEGQWGELPAQVQSAGVRREPPRWTKKP